MINLLDQIEYQYMINLKDSFNVPYQLFLSNVVVVVSILGSTYLKSYFHYISNNYIRYSIKVNGSLEMTLLRDEILYI